VATLLVLAFVLLAFVVGFVIGRESAESGGTEVATVADTTGAAGGEISPVGGEIFASAGCGTCHTLAAADASGAVGPSLDESTLTEQQVAEVVSAGRGGMPSFAGQLSEEEIGEVAAYVVASRMP
jgi:mono/diheme cytochrome c family protein